MTARAGSNRSPIAVAGLGQAGPTAEDERSIPEMALAAVEAAFADAGCSFDDIDAVVTASVDLQDGLTASNVAVTEVVGAVMRPETRIAGDGAAAAAHAACQIWAGAYETVLVVAHGKASMADQDELSGWALDPIYHQSLGASFRVWTGLQASLLAAADPDAVGRWAARAALRRTAAGAGPCTAADVDESPTVASPVRELMCAPDADGACAVVLRRGLGDVLLSGCGWDLAPYGPSDRDLTAWDGCTRAWQRACNVAHAGPPDADAFGLFEPSCRYAHEEDLFLAAVGAAADARLSPGGGLFVGTPPVTPGLTRFVVAAQALRDRRDTGRALVHGTWGPAGQAHAVATLEAA